MSDWRNNSTHHNETRCLDRTGNATTWGSDCNGYRNDMSTSAVIGITLGTMALAILMSCIMFWCFGRFYKGPKPEPWPMAESEPTSRAPTREGQWEDVKMNDNEAKNGDAMSKDMEPGDTGKVV